MAAPLTADDRLGILDLFARYAWAYDCGDAQAYAETFTENGVLADENDLRAVGRPAIAEAIKRFFEMRGASVWQHQAWAAAGKAITTRLICRPRVSPRRTS